MTTFTLQDLNGAQQKALDDQALQDMAKLGGVDPLSEMFTQMGRDLASHELAHQQVQQARLDAPPHPFKDAFKVEPVSLDEWMQHASKPQPTTGTDVPTIINTICTQLQLLATVISQSKAQPESNPNITLQETLSLTLQQADWFKDLIRHELVALDIESIAKDAVEDIVENEVESYFDHRFDPSDHFDFGDAVCSEVSDQIDDVVRDRVMDSLEEVVAEKLSEASIKVEFN